jgi:hypothetical protein
VVAQSLGYGTGRADMVVLDEQSFHNGLLCAAKKQRLRLSNELSFYQF